MMRHLKIVVVSGIAALLLPMADGQAQQDGVSRSRLMFDPAGMQGSTSRAAPLQPSTTGQSTTPRQSIRAVPPAARAPAAPQQSAAPAAKPTAAARPAARTGTPARTASPRQPARTENAGNGSATTRSSDRPIPREQPAALGRIDLPSGSLGFENRTALRDYDMSDGRKVPGFENIQRNESSYFGLSIRMPTPSSSSSWTRSHGVD